MAVDERYADDLLGFTDITLCQLVAGEAVSDTLCSSEAVVPGGIYRVLLDLQIILRSVLEMEGDVWECVALNTSGTFPSVYSNFAFNSFCNAGLNAYGADSNGIYELVGEDDDGEEIVTGILFHPTSFGNALRKKFRKVFIGADGDNIILEVVTDTGSRQFTFRREEAFLTRDLRGRNWQFAIQGFSSFRYFEAFPIYLSR